MRNISLADLFSDISSEDWLMYNVISIPVIHYHFIIIFSSQPSLTDGGFNNERVISPVSQGREREMDCFV